MTSVYSGGLVYEYSEEGSGYGLVQISGNTVTEQPDFNSLMTEYSNNKAPTGDGGYKSSGQASECPAQSSTWEVKAFTGQQLPTIPDGAQQYMSKGAGKGPGLAGAGSQDAGGASTGTATPGSGQVTATASNGAAASASASSAANALLMGELGMGPFVCGAVVLMSTFFGAALL